MESSVECSPESTRASSSSTAVPERPETAGEPEASRCATITIIPFSVPVRVPLTVSSVLFPSAVWALKVLELTATLGIHACNIGVPILLEELEAAGKPIDREFSERQLELKKDFEAKRGYWNDFWNEMLLLDADFFAAYTDFSSVPWLSGTLPQLVIATLPDEAIDRRWPGFDR